MKKRECLWIKKMLEKYLDNELDTSIILKIEEHISKCESCQAELKLLKEINSLGKTALYPEPPENYWKSISPRIITKLQGKRETILEKFIYSLKEFFAYNNLARNAVGAGAVIIIIAFIIKYTNQQPQIFQKKQEITQKVEQKETTKTETKKTELPEKPLIKEQKELTGKTQEKKSIEKIHPEKRIPEEVKIATMEKTPAEEKIISEITITKEKETSPIPLALKEEKKTEELIPAQKSESIEKPSQEQQMPTEEKTTAEKETQPETLTITEPEEKQIFSFQKGKKDIFGESATKSLFDKSPILLQQSATPEQQKMSKSFELLTTIEQNEEKDLINKKNEIIDFLKINNDPVQEIIKLKELDEIYVKLLSFEYEKEFLKEATEFYKINKNKLIKILGSKEYKKRIMMLQKINK